MGTLERIKNDLTEALKSGDTFKAETLRFILAAIHNAEIAKGKDAVLTEEELLDVLGKQAKMREEASLAFRKGNRAELAEKEEKELALIKTYLPAQMGEEEIRAIAQETIKEVGATGPADTGKVMGALMPKVKGKADGSLVAKVVRELLG